MPRRKTPEERRIDAIARHPLSPKFITDGLDEIITSPGKFEGQRRIVQVAYEQYLHGFCDEDGDTVLVEVRRDNGTWEKVFIRETDEGFVEEVQKEGAPS